MRIRVAYLPELLESPTWEETTAVVIDVLRATTVMAVALSAGAQRVVTCREIAEAQRLRQKFEGESGTRDTLLVGERGGLRIDGFDLGNSPSEYASQVVHRKTIIQTTTNGTVAIESCRRAKKLVTASFVNLGTVASALVQEPEVQIVCAGTDRRITGEDVLCAGALIARCQDLCRDRKLPAVRCVGDSALLARRAWAAVQQRASTNEGLAEILMDTQGGRNLERLGLSDDVRAAATWDCIRHIPSCNLREPTTFI